MEEVTGDGGTGEDITMGFEQQFQKLGPLVEHIILGVTDTPSANRKAWRMLEAKYPKQIWLGCAAHEVSLLFKEWIKKIDEFTVLYKEGHRIVKWVNNHAEILKLFRELVPRHFQDKRKHGMGLYNPGDTRMATVFKMLYRIKILFPVLLDMVSTPEYQAASQKALKQWSDKQNSDARLPTINGLYVDKVQHYVQQPEFLARINTFIDSTKSAIYLLRLVDRQTPVLGKFYYGCALVDKHLRTFSKRLRLRHMSISCMPSS